MVMPGGGNSLGTAQGRITIDVSNVQQAAQMVKQAAAEMTAAFNAMNQAARTAATGVAQIATASRQLNQASSRAASSVANSTRQAATAAKQTSDSVGISVQKMLNDVRSYDQAMTRVERRRGVRNSDQELFRGGAVKIDTSGIRQAETQVTTSMNAMKRSTESFGQSLQRLGGQMFVFSVAAGVLVAAGLRTEQNMQAMVIRFTALEGSAEAAQARIAGLTEEARRFNLPLSEVLAGIARLQPLLKQTGNETNRFVGLVARLATVNPMQGAEGAAIAIGEALSGTGNDFYSLQERFNIPRNLLRQAIAESDNFADALDSVLNQLGATNDVAIAFGNTFQGAFRAAKDEAMRLLGEGLKPLMKAVTPIIRAFADIAAKINDSSPFLATLLSTTLLITAAMAPLLYAVGKFAELWKTAANNARATALAQRGLRLGGVAVAAYAGVQAGIAATSLAGGESRESLESRLSEFLAQSYALIAGTFEALLAEMQAPVDVLTSSFDALASVVRNTAGSLQEGFGRLQEWIGQLVNDQNLIQAGRSNINAGQDRQYTERILNSSDPYEQLVARLVREFPERDTNELYQIIQSWLDGDSGPLSDLLGIVSANDERLAGIAEAMRTSLEAGGSGTDQLNAAFDFLGFSKSISQSFESAMQRASGQMSLDNGELATFFQRAYERFVGATGVGGASVQTGSQTSATGFNSEQIEAFRKFKDEMAELERSYNENVLAETNQYYTRRNDIILEYNERVVQAQEDEFRRRTEAEQDLAREIADLQEDSAKDQVKARRDLEAEIAKLMRESRLRVLEAASRLDARAVFEEQRRTRARIDEMRGEYDEEAQERKRQTDERIKDLQDEFKREEDKRAQDFQRRLAELDRQKNRELQQLQQQHYNRLSEMQSQYARERNARNQAFATELNDLAGHNGRVLTIHRTGMFTLEYELLAWYSRMQQQLAGGGTPRIAQPIPFPGRPAPTPYQTGTSYVPATDIYKLHAGEGVMTPSVNALARSILGGNYSQSQLAGLMTGRGGGRGQSFDFSGMQIVLGDVGNRSNADVAAMIEDGLYQFFSRAAVQARVAVA